MAAAADVPAGALGPRDFDGWFTEVEAMWKGQRFSIEVEKVLLHKKSKYQEILVFDSKSWGRVLVLDGVIQLTTKDECSYQEMMAHVPLFCHSSPDRVLIVGGGDGGVLREVVKHGKVSDVTICEIDTEVISAAKEFFGDTVATAFDDEAVTIVVEDAAEFLKTRRNMFDVIIVDSSDPTDADAPATALYQPAFLKSCSDALRDGGILCMQGECLWLDSHRDLVKETLAAMRPLFGIRDYAAIAIPTYPCGQIGMILAGKYDEEDIPSLKDRELFFRKPRRHLDLSMAAGPLRYYSDYVHEAAFVLPPIMRNALGSETCANFIASSDLPEGLPTPEEFRMLFVGMLGGGLILGMAIGRFVLPRFF